MATVITNSNIRIDGNTNLTGTNVIADSATITNLNTTSGNINADSATITNLSGTNLSGTNVTGTNVTADSATITNLSGTNLSGTNLTGTNVTATGDIKGSSFNGGQLGGRRNLIINGAMEVWQRGTSLSSVGNYAADRFTSAGGASASRDSDAPSGFTYSTKLTYSAADMLLTQPIELPATGKQGQFVAGSVVTLSYYAKVDTGTEDIYAVINFRDTKFTGTNQASFSGATAATWTTTWTRYTHSYTVPTINPTNILALVEIGGIGQTAYITGVQLEAGETATPFEYRSYGEELALCQRYYEICAVMFNGDGVGGANFIIPQKVIKRTTPTVTNSGTTGSYSYNWTFSSIGSSFNDMVVQGVSSSGGYRAHRYGITLDAEL